MHFKNRPVLNKVRTRSVQEELIGRQEEGGRRGESLGARNRRSALPEHICIYIIVHCIIYI